MPNNTLTNKPAWKALQAHQKSVAKTSMRELFKTDPQRFEKFHLTLDGLLFDYSKNLITEETIGLLAGLAEECGLAQWRDKMFSGEAINSTESRAVLHVALRRTEDKGIKIGGESVSDFVQSTLKKIEAVSEKIRKSNITDVVNIGIGGSDLGPYMVCEALKGFADGPRVHFVSNVDGAHLAQTLKGLKPETTAFIIASKTFTTLETLANAETAKIWSGKTENFYAVSSATDVAQKFGIKAENILPMRDWVGGRYSLWSAVGLSIAVSAGFGNFKKLLDGAKAADEHFKNAELKKNIPVLMALIGAWYRNFWGFESYTIIPYAQDLHRLPAWTQQLDMESNGKSVDRDGRDVDYATGPIVFGEPGTNGQHAFFQLLHQGTSIVPCDFIAAINPEHDLPGHHVKLLANMLAQSQALMEGNGHGKGPHEKFDGNRPSSTFLIERLDPYNLGMLLAFYEHKIFVQGILWNLNSFDQWGVELGKKLAKNIVEALENKQKTKSADSSTQGLLGHILKYIQ